MKEILGFETVKIEATDDGFLNFEQYNDGMRDTDVISIPIALVDIFIKDIRQTVNDKKKEQRGKAK